MSRSVTIASVQVKPAHARKGSFEFAVLSDIAGLDLFEFVQDVGEALVKDDLVDHANLRYLDVSDSEAVGRTVRLDVLVGSFGERGRVRDVGTHVDRHVHDTDEAPVLPVRLLFVLPKDSRYGLLFIEHADRRSAGKLMEEFKAAWVDADLAKSWTLKFEALAHPAAWLESARLTSVTAMAYNHESDLSDVVDGSTPKVLGDMKVVFVPKKGEKYLPLALLERLTQSQIDRAGVLGVEINGADDFDEVSVTVENEGARKTYVIGRAKTPTVRIPLTDAASRTDSSDAFFKFCLDLAPEYYERAEYDWQTSRLQLP